jgi:hypothetical protein
VKRRDFFEKSGCGLLAVIMAELGFASGQKNRDQTPKEKMSRKEMVKKMLMEKMGKTEEEAMAVIKEAEEKLPMVKDMCICRICPTYVPEETTWGFCNVLEGKSKVITEEKECECHECPVHKKLKLKNHYYCTRKSEMEQEIAKGR